MTDADRLAREQQAAQDIGTWLEIFSTDPGNYYADTVEVDTDSGALRFHAGGYVAGFPSIRAVAQQSRELAAERSRARDVDEGRTRVMLQEQLAAERQARETLEQALDDEAVRFRKRGAEIDRLEVALKSKDCEVAHWKQRWATEVDALAEQMRALLRGAGDK